MGHGLNLQKGSAVLVPAKQQQSQDGSLHSGSELGEGQERTREANDAAEISASVPGLGSSAREADPDQQPAQSGSLEGGRDTEVLKQRKHAAARTVKERLDKWWRILPACGFLSFSTTAEWMCCSGSWEQSQV